MHYEKCHICGGGKAKFIKKEGKWDVVECQFCKFVYVTPLPDEQFLYSHYQKYLPTDKTNIARWGAMMSAVFQRSLGIIENKYNHPKGCLLDIGCGYGFFLEAARQRGWHVYGIEPCVHAREYAESKGIEVGSKNLFERAYKDEMFDVVTLFYVLEHLSEPLRYLKEINRILKPGGLLLVRVPHTTPLVNFLKIFKIPNRLYDVPSHLSDFSPRAIALALEKTGFYEIHTFPGGATRPHAIASRIVSFLSGWIAEFLYFVSHRRYLLPGVSKTTIASKPNIYCR